MAQQPVDDLSDLEKCIENYLRVQHIQNICWVVDKDQIVDRARFSRHMQQEHGAYIAEDTNDPNHQYQWDGQKYSIFWVDKDAPYRTLKKIKESRVKPNDGDYPRIAVIAKAYAKQWFQEETLIQWDIIHAIDQYNWEQHQQIFLQNKIVEDGTPAENWDI